MAAVLGVLNFKVGSVDAVDTTILSLFTLYHAQFAHPDWPLRAAYRALVHVVESGRNQRFADARSRCDAIGVWGVAVRKLQASRRCARLCRVWHAAWYLAVEQFVT